MISPLDRLSYIARQCARVAWYTGHYLAAGELHRAEGRAENPPKPQPAPRQTSSSGILLEELFALFRTDLANAEAGHYPLPRDHDGSFTELLKLSREFFSDVPLAAGRKSASAGREVYDPALEGEFPAYFLQNFHYQTGGYLTEGSARLYDTQVEVLFSGSANAMRRQCIVPVSEFLRGRDQRRLKLLDVACGTGRLIRFMKQAFPRLAVVGVDLSPTYIDEARRHVAPYDAELRTAAAENLPFPDASFDLLATVYLFHEVPGEVRHAIAREMSRVLKPGGRLVFMDSLQLGDRPSFDGALKSFPRNFHEPYFDSYLHDDLPGLFRAVGLTHVSSDN
ncbi:MAG TPA: methyltransferase domain-containing protein, partial [Aestuariivirgaceae bacterium]